MKYIAWCCSWICYGIGQLLSLIFMNFDSTSTILYPIYNKLMLFSSDLSDKYKLNIWITERQKLKTRMKYLNFLLQENVLNHREIFDELFEFCNDLIKTVDDDSLPDVIEYIKGNYIKENIGKEMSDQIDSNTESLNEKEGIVFELGKAYQHSSGKQMYIIGEGNTSVYGKCLIGEDQSGVLRPVGRDTTNAINWHEITVKEWNKNFS